MKAFRKISAFLLAVVLVTSFTIPAFAADQDFSFNFAANNDSTVYVYLGSSNLKLYPNDNGTVKVNSNTTFPSGIQKWAFALYYYSGNNPYSDANNQNYTRATYLTWVSGYYASHMTYLPGQNLTNRYYRIGGRMDNQLSDPNEYHAEGSFNADDTMYS